jgi:hypothetical protein
MEGRSRDLVELLSLHLPGGTEENHRNFSQDVWDWNRASPEYKCRTLLLHQPAPVLLGVWLIILIMWLLSINWEWQELKDGESVRKLLFYKSGWGVELRPIYSEFVWVEI